MWAQIVNAALGIWLMAAPAVLGYGAPAQINDRVVGPVVATFAIVSWWGATRNVRWANVPLGAWLVAAPWLLGYGATAPLVVDTAAGLLILGLSLVRGPVDQRFGGGWRATLFACGTLHEREAQRLGGEHSPPEA